MFSFQNENEQEGGHLRSGRIFWLGKRRRTTTRRGSFNTTKGRDYELAPHLNGEYCDEKEAPNPDQNYNIPMTLCTYATSEVRTKSALKCVFVNHSNSNS